MIWRRRTQFFDARWWLARIGVAASIAVVIAWVAAWAAPGFSRWAGRAMERDLSREARSLGLTYRDAVDKTDWATGKPVYWFVTRLSDDVYAYGGEPALPVRWKGAPPPLDLAGKHGAGTPVVAVVRGAGPDGVLLEYAGPSDAILGR